MYILYIYIRYRYRISIPLWCFPKSYYSSLISYDFPWFPSKSTIVPLFQVVFFRDISGLSRVGCLPTWPWRGVSLNSWSDRIFSLWSKQFRICKTRRCGSGRGECIARGADNSDNSHAGVFTLPQCMFQYILQRWTRFENLFSQKFCSFLRFMMPWG